MSIGDWISPRHCHSNPDIRRAAVESLTDQWYLFDIARTDKDAGVRMAAVAHLSDQKLLVELARKALDSAVRQAAVEQVEDQRVLAEIAKKDRNAAVREAALKRVTDQSLRAEIPLDYKEPNDFPGTFLKLPIAPFRGHGAYVGEGSLVILDDHLRVSGSHVRSATARWTVGVVLFFVVAALLQQIPVHSWVRPYRHDDVPLVCFGVPYRNHCLPVVFFLRGSILDCEECAIENRNRRGAILSSFGLFSRPNEGRGCHRFHWILALPPAHISIDGMVARLFGVAETRSGRGSIGAAVNAWAFGVWILTIPATTPAG